MFFRESFAIYAGSMCFLVVWCHFLPVVRQGRQPKLCHQTGEERTVTKPTSTDDRLHVAYNGNYPPNNDCYKKHFQASWERPWGNWTHFSSWTSQRMHITNFIPSILNLDEFIINNLEMVYEKLFQNTECQMENWHRNASFSSQS